MGCSWWHSHPCGRRADLERRGSRPGHAGPLPPRLSRTPGRRLLFFVVVCSRGTGWRRQGGRGTRFRSRECGSGAGSTDGVVARDGDGATEWPWQRHGNGHGMVRRWHGKGHPWLWQRQRKKASIAVGSGTGLVGLPPAPAAGRLAQTSVAPSFRLTRVAGGLYEMSRCSSSRYKHMRRACAAVAGTSTCGAPGQPQPQGKLMPRRACHQCGRAGMQAGTRALLPFSPPARQLVPVRGHSRQRHRLPCTHTSRLSATMKHDTTSASSAKATKATAALSPSASALRGRPRQRQLARCRHLASDSSPAPPPPLLGDDSSPARLSASATTARPPAAPAASAAAPGSRPRASPRRRARPARPPRPRCARPRAQRRSRPAA